MKPQKGRPTTEPKILNTRVRLSKEDLERLEFCCNKTNMKKSDIIRQGIKEVYDKLSEQK